MPIVCHRIPVLDVDVYFCNEVASAKEFLRDRGGDETTVDRTQGVCFSVTDAQGDEHRVMCAFTGGVNTIVHESVHQAWIVARYCSIKVSPVNGEEPLAYLAAYLAEAFLQRFPLTPPE